MRLVIQRVISAKVEVGGEVVGEIEKGLCVLVGVARGDLEQTAEALAQKAANMRIFPDEDGKMNRSVLDTGGGVLVVSQFTLLADTGRGRRPYFGEAEDPERAEPLVGKFSDSLRNLGVAVASGVFGADMQVSLCNDGPVTVIVDSTK